MKVDAVRRRYKCKNKLYSFGQNGFYLLLALQIYKGIIIATKFFDVNISTHRFQNGEF